MITGGREGGPGVLGREVQVAREDVVRLRAHGHKLVELLRALVAQRVRKVGREDEGRALALEAKLGLEVAEEVAEKPKPKKRAPRKKKAVADGEAATDTAADGETEEKPKPKKRAPRKKKSEAETVSDSDAPSADAEADAKVDRALVASVRDACAARASVIRRDADDDENWDLLDAFEGALGTHAPAKKKAPQLRKSIRPLMETEANRIAENIKDFEANVEQYRDRFSSQPVFNYDADGGALLALHALPLLRRADRPQLRLVRALGSPSGPNKGTAASVQSAERIQRLLVAWGVHHADRNSLFLAIAALVVALLLHRQLMYGVIGVALPASQNRCDLRPSHRRPASWMASSQCGV